MFSFTKTLPRNRQKLINDQAESVITFPKEKFHLHSFLGDDPTKESPTFFAHHSSKDPAPRVKFGQFDPGKNADLRSLESPMRQNPSPQDSVQQQKQQLSAPA